MHEQIALNLNKKNIILKLFAFQIIHPFQIYFFVGKIGTPSKPRLV